jgi:hypothetical protein
LDFFDTSKPFFPLPIQQKHHWWFGVLLDLNMKVAFSKDVSILNIANKTKGNMR